MIAAPNTNGMAFRVLAAAIAAALLALGCNSTTTTPDQTCAAPYPAPTPCDASAQCDPAACTCNDGTMSAFARGYLCTDAGACDPERLCTNYCLTAGGLRSICR